jgi:RpiR family carbohydrate utilization transcriptional regulator
MSEFLERIRHQLPRLSRAERKVGELVLAQPHFVAHAPIAQIAERAEVSQPTVIRFCRSLELNGLQDFKHKLTRSLVAGVPFVHSAVSPNDRVPDLLSKMFDNTVASLLRTRNELDPAALEAAVTLLAEARRIEFYGLGNSGIVAQDAQHKFFRLGVPCVAYSDPHTHGMSAALLKPGDVVVAISNSGRTIDLIRSVEFAREAGAAVVGITQSGTPLARRCNVVLRADSPEDPDNYSPMVTRIVHLAIIDLLTVGVALQRGPALYDELEKIKRNLRERRVKLDDR